MTTMEMISWLVMPIGGVIIGFAALYIVNHTDLN